MDNTGGCLLYLNKDSLGTSITTAKSSEINVLVPDAGSDGDWVWSLCALLLHDLDFLLSFDQILTRMYSFFPFLPFNLLRNIFALFPIKRRKEKRKIVHFCFLSSGKVLCFWALKAFFFCYVQFASRVVEFSN